MAEIPPSTSHTFNDDGTLYDVHQIIAATTNLRAISVPMDTFLKQLEDNCWSDDRPEGDKYLPNFSPSLVAEQWQQEPKYKFHYDKAMAANLAFPIIVRNHDNMIIDGMHRLLKAYLLKASYIKVVYLDELPVMAIIPDTNRVKATKSPVMYAE